MKYLRTLTKKSILGYGKYSDMRVNDILKLSNGKSYLRWCYYGLSMISFNEELLSELRIHTCWLIEKPGKDLDKHEEYAQKYYWNAWATTKVEKKVAKAKYKKNQVGKGTASLHRDRKRYSKLSLQRINHGH